MKVLGAYRDNAAFYYRVTAPFSVLRYRTEHDFCVGGPSTDDAKEYGVLWLQQHADPTIEIIAREFKHRGKLVVYDVDDWLLGLPASWPCYDDYFKRGAGTPRARLYFHERLMRLADVVTCTTERLAGNLRRWLSDGGEDAPDVRVLPNCILQGEWDTIVPAAHGLDGPVLGWFGTGNHWDDWSEIAWAIDEALELVGGHLALVGAPEIVALLPERLAARTAVHPLTPMKRFDEVRRLITSFDVGLAWCTDRIEASLCRSPLKALQYGAAGVPVVASRAVYGDLPGWWDESADNSDVYLHDNGITVTSLTGMIEAIDAYLLQNWKKLRLPSPSERADSWQAEVWWSHSYERQAMMWLELLEEIGAAAEN